MARRPLPPLLRLPAAAFVLLLFLLHLPPAQTQIVTVIDDNFAYSFPSFLYAANGVDLLTFNDAGYGHGALQLTPDTSNIASSYLVNKSGRVFYSRPFKLWQLNSSSSATATATATAKQVLSFNTSFTINVFRVGNMTPGEGLAFLLSSDPGPAPPGSHGGFLGLTNASINGNPDNHFVAVEFDTVREADLGDPNDNHVGLNINGVNSTKTFSNLNFSIAPVVDANYTVWIDYDGVVRYLRVFMAIDDDPKPTSAVLEAPLDLSDYLKQEFYFGFSASTGTNYELNRVLSWNLTVQMLTDGRKGVPPWKIGAIVGGVLVVVMVLLAGIWMGLKVRKRRARDAAASSSSAVLVALKSLPGMPREFEFNDLDKATNNFDEKMKLGKGGFGEVYRGVLPGENKQVAVKRFSRGGAFASNDFLKELTIINRLRHKNLVPLVGWCHTNSVLLLVYEYMPNGSLDQHLFDGPNSNPTTTLSWERRYNVIAGVASALHYLHDEYDQRVVHRDLKASNIMLDANFNARLGDFGLARALESDKTSYAELEMAGVPGTVGYIAPECFHTGKATRESDVFGFGAVVLEVVCGRRPRCDIDGFLFLCDWVWKLFREGRILEAVDGRLGEDYDPEDARRLLLLALACSHPIPSERPKTDVTVQIVSRAVAPPAVPHFKPSFVWPSVPASTGASSWLTSGSTVPSSYEASSAQRSAHHSDREGHVAE
ncbi:putative L-type lectin-domain containing receptor kinase S.5 [Curcuma longa]|uniref:putative L-type lectin-domain containing receptor kinase S.5 n=1 Tax=Curcuma longa TaxID=136217 RepID=UPI003D9E8271